MNIKEYLSQAKYLDAQIDSKVQQLTRLRSLATKCTSTITGMPHSQSADTSSMENSITKLIDLENEINDEIDKLVNLKEEIMKVIKCVDKLEHRLVLEKRYIDFKSWDQIANEMFFTRRYVHKLHVRALEQAKKIYSKIKKEGAKGH